VTNMNNLFYSCYKLQYINILNFSFPINTYSFISLFDQYIPSSGTIIIKENFLNKIDGNYINRWNKSLS